MKIFGIGLPKTGNHSLAKAMEILGYSAKRFPESDKDIEDNDFTCDNPIIVRYQELDNKYPGSKFIMMIREDKTWLKSARNHLERRPPQTLEDSRKEMRLKRYGTLTPSNEQMLNEKHRYEEEVRDYFKNRPGDILYIDIIGGEGWNELCPFLKKPIPKQSFPKLNVTRNLLN